MASKLLSPISPLDGYSKEFDENILEEVIDLEIISLATSVEKQKLLDQNIIKFLNVLEKKVMHFFLIRQEYIELIIF